MDFVSIIGLLIGLGFYIMYLQEQRKGYNDEDNFMDDLEGWILVDDFEEELFKDV